MSGGRIAGVLFCACFASGCMGLSMNTRPRVLKQGEWRPGVATGLTRSVTSDFNLAEPKSGEGDPEPTALLEASLHYGLLDKVDIGLRLRPFDPGLKLEGMLQVLDAESPVELAVGVGVDGFWRRRSKVLCNLDDDECLYREYAGLAADAQVVVAKRLWRAGTLFGAARYAFLFVDGKQSIEDPQGRFAPVRQPKDVAQHIFGWTLGLEFSPRRVRIAPQLVGYSVQKPNKTVHFVVPSLDFAVVF